MLIASFGKECNLIGLTNHENDKIGEYYSFVLNKGLAVQREQMPSIFLNYLHGHTELPSPIRNEKVFIVHMVLDANCELKKHYPFLDTVVIAVSGESTNDQAVSERIKELCSKDISELTGLAEWVTLNQRDETLLDAKYIMYANIPFVDVLFAKKNFDVGVRTHGEYEHLAYILNAFEKECVERELPERVKLGIMSNMWGDWKRKGLKAVNLLLKSGYYFNQLESGDVMLKHGGKADSMGEPVQAERENTTYEYEDSHYSTSDTQYATDGKTGRKSLTAEVAELLEPLPLLQEKSSYHYTTLKVTFKDIDSLIHIYSALVALREYDIKYSTLGTHKENKTFQLVVCFKGTDMTTEQGVTRVAGVFKDSCIKLQNTREKLGVEATSERHYTQGSEYNLVTNDVQKLIEEVL